MERMKCLAQEHCQHIMNHIARTQTRPSHECADLQVTKLHKSIKRTANSLSNYSHKEQHILSPHTQNKTTQCYSLVNSVSIRGTQVDKLKQNVNTEFCLSNIIKTTITIVLNDSNLIIPSSSRKLIVFIVHCHSGHQLLKNR